jgi:hypothetical protein
VHKTFLFDQRKVQNVLLCTFDLINFSVCTSTPGPWVAEPHSTSWDNDQGCGHSDAATCFPIPQRHGRPLCRAGHAVYRLLIFPFLLRGAVLQQRQNRTERSKQVQTRRKIIIDGHSAGWYRGS